MTAEPVRIKADQLDLLFHPAFISRQEASAIQSCLEELEYNSDESSMVNTPGGKKKIPRKQVAYSDAGIVYRFAGAEVPGKPWPDFLIPIRDRLNTYLKAQGILPPDSPAALNYVLVNLYRDGEDYIGPHRDNEPDMVQVRTAEGKEETVIVSLSFGASRDFILQRVDDITVKHSMNLQHGDLLIMRGDTNDYWKHSVPKRLRVKTARYNLTFRFMRRPPKATIKKVTKVV